MNQVERRIGVLSDAWRVPARRFIQGLFVAVAVAGAGVPAGHAGLIDGPEADSNAQHAGAFYAARVAVLAAERFLSSNDIKLEHFDADGSDGLYKASVEPIWKKIDWLARVGNGDRAVHLSGYPAAYVIEHIESSANGQMAANINIENYGSRLNAAGKALFRITARGADISGEGHAFIQVIYEIVM
ncbi:MAG: hypothetical protein ABW088_05645 [Sedimenticola sp.]